MNQEEEKKLKQALKNSNVNGFIFQQGIYMFLAGFVGWRLGIDMLFILIGVWIGIMSIWQIINIIKQN